MLFLSAHTDDVELGCGGTIRKLSKLGHHITVIVFSNCENSLIENNMDPRTLFRENLKALTILGVDEMIHLELENRKMFEKRSYILDYLHKLNKKEKYDMIFIPWVEDLHQDHRTVSEEALRAFRRTDATILMYEVVATNGFTPNWFISLTEDELETKVMALEQYESQKILRKYFKPSLVRSIAEYRGIYVMEDYAEGFVLVRGKFFIQDSGD